VHLSHGEQDANAPVAMGHYLATVIPECQASFGTLLAGVAVQGAGLTPTIVGMGAVYLLVMLGMFLNPRLRGMDIRQEPVSGPVDVRAAVQDGETMLASRRTDIR